MRIKIEGYQENMNLLTTTNQKLMDIMSTSKDSRSDEDLQNYEKYIQDILTEVAKINEVRIQIFPPV